MWLQIGQPISAGGYDLGIHANPSAPPTWDAPAEARTEAQATPTHPLLASRPSLHSTPDRPALRFQASNHRIRRSGRPAAAARLVARAVACALACAVALPCAAGSCRPAQLFSTLSRGGSGICGRALGIGAWRRPAGVRAGVLNALPDGKDAGGGEDEDEGEAFGPGLFVAVANIKLRSSPDVSAESTGSMVRMGEVFEVIIMIMMNDNT